MLALALDLNVEVGAEEITTLGRNEERIAKTAAELEKAKEYLERQKEVDANNTTVITELNNLIKEIDDKV